MDTWIQLIRTNSRVNRALPAPVACVDAHGFIVPRVLADRASKIGLRGNHQPENIPRH